MPLGKVGRSAAQNAKQIELGCVRIAGPETAARLGVPVGTPLHPHRDELALEPVTVAYWHRNPIRRLIRRHLRRV